MKIEPSIAESTGSVCVLVLTADQNSGHPL